MTDTIATALVSEPRPLVPVDAAALHQVLSALTGPDYAIRELQVLAGGPFENPITKLIDQYNAWAKAQVAKQQGGA